VGFPAKKKQPGHRLGAFLSISGNRTYIGAGNIKMSLHGEASTLVSGSLVT
jgi:hypothetical protein